MVWIVAVIVLVVVALIAWRRLRPPKGITQFQGKVVVITGASSGIGKATAQRFAQLGAKVVLVARRHDLLEALRGQLNASAEALAADITQPDQLTTLIAEIQQRCGHIDILINNAGIVDTEPLEAINAERITSIITVNLIAPINLIRLALPLMRSQPQAHIVNVSSTVGLTLVPRQATYGASKAGLNGFSDALRRELHGTGIGVSMVMPGLVNTPMLGDFQSREEALAMLKATGLDVPGVTLNEPDEVAHQIIEAIRYQRRAVVMGGWLFRLLAWMGQHTPLWLDDIYVQMFKTEDLQKQVQGKR